MMILMSFSGIYEDQRFWRTGQNAVVLDFSGLPGTNGYCSEEAKTAIRAAIAAYPAEGMHFLDSGNYHYASLFWLEKIRRPYDLVVFDHHTDMQPSAWGDALLSCGSWIRHAVLHDRNLQKLWLAGPDAQAFRDAISRPELLPLSDRIRLTAPETLPGELRHAENRPVYISVDKDILSEKELDTNWDQGTLATDALLQSLQEICRDRNVIGIDVCGEPERGAGAGKRLQTDRINLALCQTIFHVMPDGWS